MTPLRIFGKALISIGVGVLLFVAWTLWGTGIYTGQQQGRLSEVFAREPELIPRTNAQDRPLGPPKGFSPDAGDPAFRLKIPAIDLDKIVVEGVGVEQLKLGPGHYPACGAEFALPLCLEDENQEYWPGEEGRVIVSGHRTTYGAPFWDLDKLEKGDEVITITKWGTFEYRVTEKRIVDDEAAVSVAGQTGELLLTTCNPKFSAAQRYLVFAELVTP